ncbi:MAG: TonB-dependent receptor [Marinilabiliaceae bacterium]|nr:TonB-dependent receptor [Marinilabiliaceae bacterium]
MQAQTKSIKGTVVDENNMPIPGVNVVVEGTTNGTITDFDGNYSINVSEDAKLIFSFIGYNNQVLPATSSPLNVKMEPEFTALDEVVAVGYGTQKRKDVTGSVASVSAESLAAIPVASASEALTGKMAGVQITTTEGSPDAEVTIRVRGGGSITGDNSPLFIVDGFPVESISDIAPSDIESIDVLKDASSTAIYGSRGANGVVLVTTKSGKEGKVQVAYNAFYSVKKLTKKLDVLSSKDYVMWQYELMQLKKGNTEDVNPTDFTEKFGNWEDIDLYDDVKSNDWQDLTFGRLGSSFNHNLSIMGGGDSFKYNISYAMVTDKAIMEMSGFKRDNFSAKFNSKPHKKIGLDFSMRYSKTKVFGASTSTNEDKGSTRESRVKYAVIFIPFPVKGLISDEGETDPDFNLYNPIESISDNDRLTYKKQFNAQFAFSWEILDGLKLKSEVGFNDNKSDESRFFGLTTYYVKNNTSIKEQPAVSFVQKDKEGLRSTNTLNLDINKLFVDSEDHTVNVLLGHEYFVTHSKSQSSITDGLPVFFTSENAFNMPALGSAMSIERTNSPDDVLVSWFARANYDYQSKYLLSATFRADGSSKFGEGNRWGFFPSAALAWRISSESFMENTNSWLDDMKVRVSFGTAGNNNIPADQINRVYSAKTTTWINGLDSYMAPSNKMTNKDLSWETTITRNLGLDFTMLNSKLSGSFEAYYNSTRDLLIDFPTQGTGYDSQYRNMGETENKGFELSINYNPINRPNGSLTISANIGINRSKIVDLAEMGDNALKGFTQMADWNSDITKDFLVVEGGRVGQMYGFKSAGRYEASDFTGYQNGKFVLAEGVTDCSAYVDLRPGSMKLQDLTGDGKVDENDMTVIGDANPDFAGGFNISGTIYGFDLSANFTYSIGQDVYNANKVEFTQTRQSKYRNLTSEMASGKRWTNLRADGTMSTDLSELAQMNANTTMWSPYTSKYITTDWAIEDASFLRLATATVGYTIPTDITKKWHIQKARIYCSGYNLFVLTDYTGYDPEVSTCRKTNMTPNVDFSAYPKSRQFVVGLNLNF